MKNAAQLYEDIMEKLKFEPSVDASHITVGVNGEVVTLGGKVGNLFEKYAAERAVKSIAGVKGIANELEVELAGDYQLSDTEIARAATNALEWNGILPRDQIQVSVEQGCVTLTGNVNWWYQHEAAEKAIRRIRGVKSLNNQILINKGTSHLAQEIKSQINKEFHRHAQIDADRIRIEVDSQGNVTLTGKVHSWAELMEARRGAWSARGVTHVKDQLIFD